jgi:hypothetical protein
MRICPLAWCDDARNLAGDLLHSLLVVSIAGSDLYSEVCFHIRYFTNSETNQSVTLAHSRTEIPLRKLAAMSLPHRFPLTEP